MVLGLGKPGLLPDRRTKAGAAWSNHGASSSSPLASFGDAADSVPKNSEAEGCLRPASAQPSPLLGPILQASLGHMRSQQQAPQQAQQSARSGSSVAALDSAHAAMEPQSADAADHPAPPFQLSALSPSPAAAAGATAVHPPRLMQGSQQVSGRVGQQAAVKRKLREHLAAASGKAAAQQQQQQQQEEQPAHPGASGSVGGPATSQQLPSPSEEQQQQQEEQPAHPGASGSVGRPATSQQLPSPSEEQQQQQQWALEEGQVSQPQPPLQDGGQLLHQGPPVEPPPDEGQVWQHAPAGAAPLPQAALPPVPTVPENHHPHPHQQAQQEDAQGGEQIGVAGGRRDKRARLSTSAEDGAEAEAATPVKKLRRRGGGKKKHGRRGGVLTPSKYADLLGKTVEVPAAIFSVDVPDLFYRGVVTKREPGRKQDAMELKFLDDGSKYWFPITEIRGWLRDMEARGGMQANAGIASGKTTDEFAAEVLTDIASGGTLKSGRGASQITDAAARAAPSTAGAQHAAAADGAGAGGGPAASTGRAGGDAEADSEGELGQARQELKRAWTGIGGLHVMADAAGLNLLSPPRQDPDEGPPIRRPFQ